MGLGGVLTATGIGTLVEKGKQIVEVDGKPYLLEKPIQGDFALIGCKQSDYYGNLEYSLTAHNFNPIMALAGEVVIAEPHHIVPVGVISPGRRQDAGRARHPYSRKGHLMEDKDIIAQRVAQEIKPEMLVNLGIGLPSLVANLPAARTCTCSSRRRTASSASARARPRAWRTRTSPTPAAASSPPCRAPPRSTAP